MRLAAIPEDVRFRLLGTGAMIGIPLLFCSICWIQVQTGWLNGDPLLPMCLCVAAGTAMVAAMRFTKLWVRIMLAILYIPASLLVLLLLGLSVACANGDCL